MTQVHTTSNLLHSIAAQASSLGERLQQPNRFLTPNRDETKQQERWQTWCQNAAKGDRDRFSCRLTGIGWDTESVLPYLGEVELAADQPLPTWTETLQAVMQTSEQWTTTEFDVCTWQFPGDRSPTPFEPFFGPCLQVAQHKLTQTLAQAPHSFGWQRWSETAQQSLLSSLLDRLVQICTPTLFQEFSQFRTSGNSLRDFFSLQFQGRQSQQKYHAFLRQVFQGGFRDLFTTYPVLARLIAVAIDFWASATVELVQQLAADWGDIEQHFIEQQIDTTFDSLSNSTSDLPSNSRSNSTSGSMTLSQVVDVQSTLSDSHNQGRTVSILQFDTGLKLVYKPKNLGTDVAFFGLLQWCNERGLSLPLKSLKVLNREDYGWIEYVPSAPCEDTAAIKRFYQRSGMLLCLIYVIEGTDCHAENIIAYAEQPVLIDTETLLTPRMEGELEGGDLAEETPSPIDSIASPSPAKQLLQDSVKRTALLPQWGMVGNDRYDIDFSGLGGHEDRQLSVMQWQDINTDGMKLEVVTQPPEPPSNAPTLQGEALSAAVYLEDVVTGFEQMFQFLLQHQTELLSCTSPLNAFSNQTLRYVFRATNTYGIILQQSYEPTLLKSGVDRSIALDVLSRAFLTDTQLPNYWKMLAIEWQSMEQMDIPFFTFNSSDNSLPLAKNDRIVDFFIRSGFEQVQTRLRQLSLEICRQQVNIIRGAFETRFLQPPILKTQHLRTMRAASHLDRILPSEVAVQQATQIANQLRQSAIARPDGLTWLGWAARPSRPGCVFDDVGFDLCYGSSGITLFLAALAQTTGEDQWRDFAWQTLQPCRQMLLSTSPEQQRRWANQQGIRGTTGLAGMVYSFVQLSQMLAESALLSEAKQLAALITRDTSATALEFGLSEGIAGMILGLLVLPQDAHAQQTARLAGEYLLDCHSQNQNQNQNYDHSQKSFHHGIAGIAYTLLRLYEQTQDDRFRQTAITAIESEQHIFSAQWQNHVAGSGDSRSLQWIQEAAGIGLARLAGLPMLDTPEIRQEIDAALDVTQRYLFCEIDSLSWGTVGRLETLLVAAQRLDRWQLHQVVAQAMYRLVHKSQQQGYFTLLPGRTAEMRSPGLFHGLAGIGYQLLRLANPDLPSVLLWEI